MNEIRLNLLDYSEKAIKFRLIIVLDVKIQNNVYNKYS